MDRYKTFVDVHLILLRGDKILLGLRQNTGFADGHWHLPAGHTEDGESATTGLIREAKEETGITVQPDDVRFAHIMHHMGDSGRIALFYETNTWTGEIVNAEPHKCVEWCWFPTTDLSQPMIPYAMEALTYIARGWFYSERGW